MKIMKSFAFKNEVFQEKDYYSCNAKAASCNTSPNFNFKLLCALGDSNEGRDQVRTDRMQRAYALQLVDHSSSRITDWKKIFF